MIGVGLRSNYEACQQLMERDLLGTRRLAVVRDDFEQHQVCPCSFAQVRGLFRVRDCRAAICAVLTVLGNAT